MALLAVLPGLALVLAAVGVYWVLFYSVLQRPSEMGIRLALGDPPHDLLGLIVGQGMRPALFGLITGLLGAAALTRFMASLLFQVSVIDPLVYGLVGLGLLLVAIIACVIPAFRALRLDPAK